MQSQYLPIPQVLQIYRIYQLGIILIDCEIALKEDPQTTGSEAVSIVSYASDKIAGAMQSLYTPLPPAVQNCPIG